VFKARLRRQEYVVSSAYCSSTHNYSRAFISKHGVEAHRAMLEKIRDRENAAWAAKLAEEDEAQRAAHAARQQSATSHTQV
jgi:hypothetical protein